MSGVFRDDEEINIRVFRISIPIVSSILRSFMLFVLFVGLFQMTFFRTVEIRSELSSAMSRLHPCDTLHFVKI